VGELSVRFSEQEIVFADDGVFVGKLSKSSIQPDGLQLFVEQYNELLGSVKYQPWLRGVMAGLSLAFGVPTAPRLDAEEISPTDELTGDGSGESAPPLGVGEIAKSGELDLVVDGLPHGGLTPSRSPESETIVPSAETPAAVGETIVPVSASQEAASSDEHGGLTPSRSPEAGVVSP